MTCEDCMKFKFVPISQRSCKAGMLTYRHLSRAVHAARRFRAARRGGGGGAQWLHETVWPSNPKLCTIWPFTGKACHSCSKLFYFRF